MASGTEELRQLDIQYGDKMETLFGPTLLGFPEGCDSSRLNMFSSNAKQFLTLLNPDVPHIMTGYENFFGEMSHGYKKMEGTWEVRKVIPKYGTGDVYMMFLYCPETDTWDCVEKQIAENLTEKFGFPYNTAYMDSLQEGDTFTDQVLYRSTSYDDQMNYRIGKNARVMYVTDNATIEDAIKIRAGWAKDVQSVEVDEVRVGINSNDFLKNLYGDENTYKSFPDIGQKVHDTVVCAVGRVNLNHALYDFQESHLRVADYTDAVYHAPKGSIIYDIDIYYNGEDEFPNNDFYSQLRKYYDMECEYADKVSEMCDIIESSGSRYTPQISYMKAKYQHFTDRTFKWKDRDRAFANIVVVFKTMSVVDLQEGFKLTGRYGDKGIISKISFAGLESEKQGEKDSTGKMHVNVLDQFTNGDDPSQFAGDGKGSMPQMVADCDMPYYYTPEGEKVIVDILLNSSGAVRRLNSDQLYEVEINFIAENLQRYIKTLKTNQEKIDVILKFLSLLNEEQHDYYMQLIDSYDQVVEVDGYEVEFKSEKSLNDFIQDVEENGFYIVKRPHSKMRYDCVKKLYETWPWIKPYDVYIDLFGIQGKKIMRPAVIGSKYMCLLKQTSNKNFSARSTGRTDKRQVPAKSNDKKTNLAHYSRNPIKIGESHNLMAGISGATLASYNIFMRSSPVGRKSLDRIITATGDPFDIPKLKVEDNHTNINAQILEAYLKAIGIGLQYEVEDQKLHICRDVVREFHIRGYIVYDHYWRKPVYEKLLDLYEEFFEQYTVISADPRKINEEAWNWVFTQPDIEDLKDKMGSISKELMMSITANRTHEQKEDLENDDEESDEEAEEYSVEVEEDDTGSESDEEDQS